MDVLGAKSGVKMALYTVAAQLAKVTGISALRKLPNRKNSLRVLMYHKICDDWPNVVTVGTQLFQDQQEYLARNYRVISLDELAAFIDRREPLPARAVVLTFDDGYKNNLVNAYPVLKRLGHKAVIFVPTDFIGGGTLPHDRVLANPDRVLNWDELHSMLDVFEVGSHCCSHRILTTLSPREVAEEVCLSKAVLEGGLGRPVRAFAYPNGSIGDFNDETDVAVKEAGYKFCFTTIPGTNLADMNPLGIRRYNVEDFGMAYFKCLLDGSADIVGLKDTRVGYRLKGMLNRSLGLEG